MNLRLLQALLLGAAILYLVGAPGCALDQELISIGVSPKDTTVIGQGLELQYTALGRYVHPEETKDITTTVIWKSQADQIISFITPDRPGLATSGAGCGTNIGISATVYSNPSNPADGTAIVGRTTVNVEQPNNPNCP
jgi:hypothetical protein